MFQTVPYLNYILFNLNSFPGISHINDASSFMLKVFIFSFFTLTFADIIMKFN